MVTKAKAHKLEGLHKCKDRTKIEAKHNTATRNGGDVTRRGNKWESVVSLAGRRSASSSAVYGAGGKSVAVDSIPMEDEEASIQFAAAYRPRNTLSK
jgi:hypothetical protein